MAIFYHDFVGIDCVGLIFTVTLRVDVKQSILYRFSEAYDGVVSVGFRILGLNFNVPIPVSNGMQKRT